MKRKRAYREILRSIDRLERELFPEWFPKNEPPWLPEHWSMAPGSVWQINDPREVMLWKRNLVRSALYGDTEAA